jgi:hypothetical protein
MSALDRRMIRQRELPKRDESYLGRFQNQSRKEIVEGAMNSLRNDLKKIVSKADQAAR